MAGKTGSNGATADVELSAMDQARASLDALIAASTDTAEISRLKKARAGLDPKPAGSTATPKETLTPEQLLAKTVADMQNVPIWDRREVSTRVYRLNKAGMPLEDAITFVTNQFAECARTDVPAKIAGQPSAIDIPAVKNPRNAAAATAATSEAPAAESAPEVSESSEVADTDEGATEPVGEEEGALV